MGRNKLTITDREKAAIFFHLYGGVDDWKLLFRIARPGELDKGEKESPYLKDVASKWKNSPKIQDYLKEVREKKMRADIEREDKIREEERRRGESESTKSEPRRGLVDYSDPANRKRLYNEVIRDAGDDPKTRLDAAKVFEQIQRDDKQAAKDQQIQRFYTPVTCRDCIIKANFARLRREMKKQADNTDDGTEED